MKNLSFLLLICLACQVSVAQGFDMGTAYDTVGAEQRVEIGIQAINDLKAGVLVFRLRTGSSKVDALSRLIQDHSLTAAERQRFEKMQEEVLAEIRKENEDLMTAFRNKYDFSPVLYMPDTVAYRIKNGEQAGFFLDENLAIDPSISLGGRPFLVAYHGLASSAQKTTVEGIVVLDHQLQELVEPFPFFTGMTTVKKKLAAFFNKVEEVELFSRLVERFDKRVERFYDVVN